MPGSGGSANQEPDLATNPSGTRIPIKTYWFSRDDHFVFHLLEASGAAYCVFEGQRSIEGRALAGIILHQLRPDVAPEQLEGACRAEWLK